MKRNSLPHRLRPLLGFTPSQRAALSFLLALLFLTAALLFALQPPTTLSVLASLQALAAAVIIGKDFFREMQEKITEE